MIADVNIVSKLIWKDRIVAGVPSRKGMTTGSNLEY